MEKNDTYFFHQTPDQLASDLIAHLDIDPSDKLYEPFRGESAFYNAFPTSNNREWTEITEGRDYKDYTGEYDWVITNPPFRLETGTKRINAFWYLLDYYTQRAKKGVAFLANDRCFSSLTPKRVKQLSDRGWYITKLIVCSIKKWRGRYYFFVVEKRQTDTVGCLLTNY